VDIPYLLPGTTEPAITIVRPGFGSPRVLVNGVRVKGRRGGRFTIPLADGTTTELQLKGQWSGLKAVVDGVETPLEPPMNRGLVALTFLPLFLVILGGLIGGLIAGGALAINTWLIRRTMPVAARIIGVLGVTALAVVIWFGIAYTISPIASFQAGTCVNGVRANTTISANATRPVDCEGAHDAEVVATITYPGDGPYPGEPAITEYATTPCLEAFATYVGNDFETSTLDMLPTIPSELSWPKGDRQIACIVMHTDASPMTGSVKGSGL
jgi:hypothetical protein